MRDPMRTQHHKPGSRASGVDTEPALKRWLDYTELAPKRPPDLSHGESSVQ